MPVPVNVVRLFSSGILFAVFATQISCNLNPDEQVAGTQFELQLVECWFQVPAITPETQCYFMHVPQNYRKPDGRWIKFPVVRISAPSSIQGKSPVLHLGGGGPGNPIGFWPDADVSWLWNLYQGMSVDNHRDLYIIDPRGVGLAEPSMACFEYADMIEEALAENLTLQEESSRSMEAYGICRDRLIAQGVDLSLYNSKTIARDVDQLRQELGIAQWSLYGVSYGTRYAQTIARDFPGTVESMVLDATTFMGINYTERSAEDLLQTIQRLFAYCEAEKVCSESLGDVGQRFWDLASSLSENPPLFTIDHPYYHEEISVVLTGDRFLNAYYLALYDADFYTDLPEIIVSLENGKPGKFRSAIENWIQYVLDREYSDGSAIAHYCYEEAPFVNFDIALENTKVLPPLIRDMMVEGLVFSDKQCQDWGVSEAGKIENEPITTDIPTLFLHGELDPVLPVEDLWDQSRNFNNSDRVIFKEISHGIVGAHPCGIELAGEFFDHKLEFRKSITCL
jgi:pimeloyl-ACP methyl ester carboxylesterase